MKWTHPVELRRSFLFVLPGLAVAIVAGLLHAETWSTLLFDTWRGEGYGHGPLLAVIALILLLRRRGGRAADASPSLAGLAAVIVVLGLWEVASLLAIQGIEQACAILVAFVGIWAVRGPAVARELAFPLLILLAAISLWDLAFGPLQDAAVVLSRIGVRAIGIPAYFDENFITIPNGVFIVETVCAGLSYVLAGLAFALLYAHLYFSRLVSQCVFVVVTISWVVVLNAVRVVVVVVFGHVSGMDHPAVRDHGEIGWAIFAVGLVPLVWLGGRIEELEASRGNEARVGAASEPVSERSAWFQAGTASIAAVLIAVGAAGLKDRTLPLGDVAVDDAAFCDPAILGESGWRPRYRGAAREECFRTGEGGGIAVYVAHFPKEQPGGEMIGYGSTMHGADESSLLSLGQAGGFREAVHVDASGRTRITLWRYRVAGRWTSSDILAKMLRLPALVFSSTAPMVVGASLTVRSADVTLEREQLLSTLREEVRIGIADENDS